MAGKPTGYTYRLAFPASWDGPRGGWPRGVVDRFERIAGVVDVAFAEISAAWQLEEGEPRSESRRRMIWITTSNAQAAWADATRGLIVALACDLADRAGIDRGDVVVERWATEVLSP